MSIRQAIQLNNQAVSLLESKRFSEAIPVACAAMEVFQKQTTPTGEQVHLHDNDFVDRCILSRNRDCISDSRNTMDEEYTYGHGIMLPLNTVDGTLIIPVLIFNCALSHHLAARHCNEHATSQQFLNRARSLYTLAYNELNQDQNLIFQAVVVNNVGAIHKSLGNYEEAQACFDYLTSMLMMMIYYTEETSSGENNYRQHVQGFWKNILGNERSTAPAA